LDYASNRDSTRATKTHTKTRKREVATVAQRHRAAKPMQTANPPPRTPDSSNQQRQHREARGPYAVTPTDINEHSNVRAEASQRHQAQVPRAGVLPSRWNTVRDVPALLQPHKRARV
jgi:hypothetical protein